MNIAPATDTVVMREPGGGRGTWAMNSLFEHLLESPPGTDRLGVALDGGLAAVRPRGGRAADPRMIPE